METGEEKVENSVQDIADDLIKLYAEREASKGYAFSPDHEMRGSSNLLSLSGNRGPAPFHSGD